MLLHDLIQIVLSHTQYQILTLLILEKKSEAVKNSIYV